MAPKKAENSERINVFFSPSAIEQLREAADERGATISGLVRMIVTSWLRKEEAEKEHREH
jgi:hypothetical protein